MVTKIVMPKLSLTMTEGTVGKWYKKTGESVEKNEPIVEIISEKAAYDLEAPASGVLRKILVDEGMNAPVDAPIGIITDPDESYIEAEALEEEKEKTGQTAERLLASPAAKRLAKEHGIQLSQIASSGPGGRIVEEDVKKAIQSAEVDLPRIKEIVKLSGFRKTSAERVSLSFRSAPHSTVIMDVDMTKAYETHERLQVSYTAILLGAVAKALAENPTINATYEKDSIKIFADINLGVAVATDYGLAVPIVRNADAKSLKEIDSALSELSEKAKQEKLSKEDVTGGTFTVTNLGMYGVDFFIPIINPPEAAILAAGRIQEKAVAVDGKIAARSIMTLSLTYDHRIVDGAPAAKFLQKVKNYVENPDIFR